MVVHRAVDRDIPPGLWVTLLELVPGSSIMSCLLPCKAWPVDMCMRMRILCIGAQRHWPDVGATSQRHRSDIGPTSERRRSAIGPTSERRRSVVAASSQRHGPDVAAPSQRHRPDVGATSQRHRSHIGPTSARSQPHRPDIGPTSLRHVGNALLGHHSERPHARRILGERERPHWMWLMEHTFCIHRKHIIIMSI